jgi:hypothetical protein
MSFRTDSRPEAKRTPRRYVSDFEVETYYKYSLGFDHLPIQTKTPRWWRKLGL